MFHTMVKLETMTAESKQQALELETMRQKYEAWMKRVEDLTNENELLKWELRKVKEEQGGATTAQIGFTGKRNRNWPNFKKTARPRNRNTSRSWVT